MSNVLLGNIIAFIAALLMVYTGILIEKNKIIILQIFQMLLLVVSNFILGSLPGAINNLIGCFRNYLCHKNKLNGFSKIMLVILIVSLCLYFNTLGVIVLLPITATILYTLFMDSKDVVKFKLLIIVTMVMWLIHDVFVKSYVMVVMDVLTIITTSISLYKICGTKK